MIICPEEPPRCIKTQTPIHIPCLPPAASAPSQHFHLPPHYETHQLTINISLSTVNLIKMNISSPRIQNMATSRGPLEWEPCFSTWLTYHQFLLVNSIYTWSAVTDLSLHLCQPMSQ